MEEIVKESVQVSYSLFSVGGFVAGSIVIGGILLESRQKLGISSEEKERMAYMLEQLTLIYS